MIKRMLIIAGVMTVAFLPVASALREFHGAEPMGVSGGAPAELRELILRDNRFAGENGFPMDDWMFYTGDAPMVNDFLKVLAGIPEVGAKVVLHPGTQMTDMSRYDGTNRKIAADWVMQLRQYYQGHKSADDFGDHTFLAWVHVYLGGEITLKTLDVPLALEVVDAGDIPRFVAVHEKRQAAAENEPAEVE